MLSVFVTCFLLMTTPFAANAFENVTQCDKYSSRLGPSFSYECVLGNLTSTTSDECGDICATEEGCACAVHERGSCIMLKPDCCSADILTPCPATGVVEQSGLQFQYVPGGLAGTAITTRYWDCSKPSCSWPSGLKVTAPPRSCHRDGWTAADPYEQSGSAPGGTAFACTNQQPRWSIDPSVSFGFVAFEAPEGRSRSCCACLELKFSTPNLAGKRFIVQVININGGEMSSRKGGYVEMAIPGGGIGGVNGCKSQWNAGASWGELYGGLGSSKSACYGLPEPLQRGCRWQYDWLLDTYKPNVTYREIVCPWQLTNVSGCKRL